MSSRRTKSTENKPRQARGQATIDAILEATIRILERESLEHATTTRIAEIAGVSVGTLYHHFEDRDAILHALQEREFARALAMMQDVLSQENLGAAPRETVERVVRGLATLYESSPALHRVLAIEGLRVANAERVHAFDLRVIDVVRGFLLQSREHLRAPDASAAAFVAYQSVRATMLASLLERPPGLDLDTLVGQLVDLVVRYLIRDDAAGATEQRGA
ncbi:MAG: TetR family transcriptional regulator [Labilithrix sp.]|nr:TetR family transcriptional regulator [Labilithrix sp.]